MQHSNKDTYTFLHSTDLKTIRTLCHLVYLHHLIRSCNPAQSLPLGTNYSYTWFILKHFSKMEMTLNLYK